MRASAPANVGARLALVRLLVLDVDGVLTDGTLYYGPEGEVLKPFHVRDGLGIHRLIEAGIEVAVITGRGNAALARRLADLGIEHVVTRCQDKWAGLEPILERLAIPPDAMAVVGDDIVDLPMMDRAGLSIAVADAHLEVRRRADWTTAVAGGRGAVREIADALLMARQAEAPRFRVVIPARFGSTRLPGKPLLPIAGRPMIAHVWDRATESGATEVVVATDDQRILDAVHAFGGRAVLTSSDHPSGTDRLAEVAQREGWSAEEIVVNLQGDEPGMLPPLVRELAIALMGHPSAGIATAATAIGSTIELFDPAIVKVVLDDRGMASYFSRAPIPWVRGTTELGPNGMKTLPQHIPFLRHLGIYAYRVGMLQRITKAPPSLLERCESLEQLRALALGIGIHVTITSETPPHGVDTQSDLERAARELGGKGSR